MFGLLTVSGATNAVSYQNSIVTYVGGTNTVLEPSILYFPSGWGSDSNAKAWKYWMTAGPFEQSNEAYENSSVWVSDDGQTWQVPPGLTNPVSPARASGNNCDPQLFYNTADGLMYLFNTWQNSTHSADNGVRYWTSSNGITWTGDTRIITTTVGNPNVTLSPRVLYQDGLWHCWVLNASGATYEIRHRSASSLAGLNAASETACTGMTPSGDDTQLWEFEIKWIVDRWWMLLCSRGGKGRLYLCYSLDGIAWVQSNPFLTGTGASTWDKQMYKSAFQLDVVDPNNLALQVWYSANNAVVDTSYESHIGYTTATVVIK